jgi:hypothetical protein
MADHGGKRLRPRASDPLARPSSGGAPPSHRQTNPRSFRASRDAGRLERIGELLVWLLQDVL